MLIMRSYQLSPKKTWEGFIGASFTTVIAAFVLADVLGCYQWLTCPRKDLTTGWLHCDPGPLYKPEYHALPGWISKWLPWKEIPILPVQWHALCLGLFALIIAPFGGFFASGFKRAFKIKDFGDSIPGQGGMTGRMDCRMVMAVFAYIWHQSFVVLQGISGDMLLDQVLPHLQAQVKSHSPMTSILLKQTAQVWIPSARKRNVVLLPPFGALGEPRDAS